MVSLVKNFFALLFLAALTSPSLRAQAETIDAVDLESPESVTYTARPSTTKWVLFSAAEAATILLVSQTQNGPLIFGGAYAAATLFTMRELLYDKNDDNFDFVLPAGLLAMSVLNFALLNNNSQYSYGSVFTYNIIGAGLLTAYAWWQSEHRSTARRSYALLPMLGADHFSLSVIF